MHSSIEAPNPSSAGANFTLRAVDVVLAFAVAALTLPFFLLLVPGGRCERTAMLGRDGDVFQRLRWLAAPGWRARLARRTRLEHWPVLANILAGEMSWVGPRALDADDDRAAAAVASGRNAVAPGVFSLWQLRRQTSIDYGDEWSVDLDAIARRSLRHDLGILFRSLLTAGYGRQDAAPVDGKVLIDTVRVESVTMDETLDRIERRLDEPAGAPMQVCFVNPHCVNVARRDPAYRAAIAGAQLVVPDGVGMRIAGKLLRRPLRQNVNGTDLFPLLCARLAARRGRLYLLGARLGVAQKVADWVEAHHPGVQVVGATHGYFEAGEIPDVLADIRASRADVLLVAMGVPGQDRWVAEHAAEAGVKVAMGVGGLFDFFSGAIPRAPQWLRELGLEWAYRLWQEPGRMWRRYLLGNASFLVAVAMQRWLGSVESLLQGEAPRAAQGHPSAARAVVMALAPQADPLLRESGVLPVMLPLGDRPLLQRNLDTLAGLGVREVDLFAAEGVAEIKRLVADGARWGLRVRIHAVRDHTEALLRLSALDLPGDAPIWFAQAWHWLPAATFAGGVDEAAWFHEGAEGESRWSGWACLPRKDLFGLAQAAAVGMAEDYLAGHVAHRQSGPEPFSHTSVDTMLAAQARWLARRDDRFEVLHERGPGLRVAASARIAPDAVLIAPVEIGEHAVVASGARVGPGVVLGRRTFIDRNAVIEESLVADHVMIGADASVACAIATETGILNARWQAWLPARLTGNALSSTARPAATPRPAAAERLFALAAYALVGLPAACYRALGGRSDFARRVSPGLLGVARGQLSLVGVGQHAEVPPSVREAGWADKLAAAHRGLIRPEDAYREALNDEEARAWADVYLLASPGWRPRWRILRDYALNRGGKPG